jgi:hypothetical protein
LRSNKLLALARWLCSRWACSATPRLREVHPAREGPRLPTSGAGGFFKILDAVAVLESAGFGFGKPGSKYEYDAVAARTPTDSAVNTISIA